MLAPNHESLQVKCISTASCSLSSPLSASFTGCTFTCQMSTRLRLSHFSCKSHAPASCYNYDGSFNISDAFNHHINRFLMTLRSPKYLVVTCNLNTSERKEKIIQHCFDMKVSFLQAKIISLVQEQQQQSCFLVSFSHAFVSWTVTMSVSINVTCETLSSLLLFLLRSDYQCHPLSLSLPFCVLSLPQNQIESQSHWFSLSLLLSFTLIHPSIHLPFALKRISNESAHNREERGGEERSE